MNIYKKMLRPLLFSGLKADPEILHKRSLKLLNWLEFRVSWLLPQLEYSFGFQDTRLEQNLWGINFPNPLGLAAGFDKDGMAAGVWGSMGFGFAELGTVTYYPQPGNPLPRLFRLPEDEAALNRMGFNNQGSSILKESLAKRKGYAGVPWGINLGKSKVTPLEEAAADYLGSFRRLQDWGSYFVVNVSSPNTPGLRSLQDAKQLSLIVDALQQENQNRKPILVKIAPDLSQEAIADVINLVQNYQLAGIIATNTTIRRDNLQTTTIPATQRKVIEEAGGISGKPISDRATEVIRFIYQQTQGQLTIIGVGGIFNAEDAWEKITAGASLIQVYTGWVYEGPGMVRRVLKGLLQKLEEHKFNSITEAVGLDSPQK
ncbi:MAG: quinone-dependent dihydroorotate dehydrogenase [Spirulinaceae cyanobacterium]